MKKIKILGTGCRKCQQLAENAEAAAKNLGIDYQLEKVVDLNDIVAHGVMMTPAIVIDDQVRSSGKVLSPEDIEQMLE